MSTNHGTTVAGGTHPHPAGHQRFTLRDKIRYDEPDRGFDGMPGPMPPAVPTITQRMSSISGQCADVVYRLEGLLNRVRPMDKRNESIPIDGCNLTDAALYTENALEDCRRLLSALEEVL